MMARRRSISNVLLCGLTVTSLLLLSVVEVAIATYGSGNGNGNNGNGNGNVDNVEDPETTQYTMIEEPSDPNGKEVVRCLARNNCYLQTLKCPSECPKRVHTRFHKTSCFVDCSRKCQTTCKNRKPNCNGYSSVCYDPRFVGGDGVMFYFHGKANERFCLLSDSNLHINAHFIGIRPQGRTRDFTWVQTLGIMFDNHKLSIGARPNVPSWDDKQDQLLVTYDGQEVQLANVAGATWASPMDEVEVERLGDTNSVQVKIDGLLGLSVQVVPITHEEDRVHGYGLPSDDCFAHLNVQFKFMQLTTGVDGVLGQTYRPGFQNPVKVGVPMPVMGGEPRYRVSSLFATDCPANRFSATLISEAVDAQGGGHTACASTFGAGGMLCRRR